MRDWLHNKLFKPVDFISLELFRIVFIVVLIFQFYSFSSFNYLEQGILAPRYLFCFEPFAFLSNAPDGLIKFLYALLLIAPLVMFYRKAFRIAMFVFLVAFSFFFLIEQSYYNNHFYLIILYAGFWLLYKPVDQKIPGWLVFLFQIQLFIVYFYGGIAKLNSDWLFRQEPVQVMLQINAERMMIPGMHTNPWVIGYFTYGGLIFDLVIGFLLFNRRTLWFGIILNILFHLNNTFIFNMGEGGDIGIFPMMMIFTNLLFIPPEIIRKVIQKTGLNLYQQKITGKQAPILPVVPVKKVSILLGVYLAIQLLLPFRHFLITDEVDWTGQSQFFSWRMKVHAKSTLVQFYYQETPSAPKKIFPTGKFINTMQISQMAQHVNMIYQFVQFIRKDLKKKEGLIDPIITADLQIGLNGRPNQPFISPELNLTHIEYNTFSKPNWVLPLKR